LRNLRALKPEAKIAVLRLATSIESLDVPEGANFQFSRIEEAIQFNPKAAIIAGPATTHVAVALALAEAGISLLIEKPIADTTHQLEKLLKVCKEKNLTLMTGYNLRFLPSLLEAKRMYEANQVGDVYSVRAEVGQYLPDWRPQSDYRQTVTAQQSLGGGALLELSHEIDYIYWIFGMPSKVTMRADKVSDLEINVEDVVELLLEYESPKRIVNIHLDLLQRAPFRQCKLIGKNGTLIWDGIKDRVEYFNLNNKSWTVMDEFTLVDKNKMYLDELALFIDSVSATVTNVISGEQGADVLKIIEAAKESLQTNTTITINAS
jgi:predicted dehydrogenase